MAATLSELWAVVQPSVALGWLAILGLIARLVGARRLAGGVITVVLLALAGVALLPIQHWLLRPLEERFPPVAALEEPDRVDGVVVLGGFSKLHVVHAWDVADLNDSAERFTALLGFARRFPEAKVVFSGGGRSREDETVTEAAAVEALLQDVGFSGRVIVEGDSRNTFENAVFTQRLVEPQPGQTWWLVTSAWHMPRAMAVFEGLGWDVRPYAVDYRTGKSPVFGIDRDFPVGRKLALIDLAVKEYVALLGYRLLGRT